MILCINVNALRISYVDLTQHKITINIFIDAHIHTKAIIGE